MLGLSVLPAFHFRCCADECLHTNLALYIYIHQQVIEYERHPTQYSNIRNAYHRSINCINISSKVSKGDHLNGHSFLVSFQLAACNKIIISENPKSNRLNLKFSDPSSQTVNLIRSCYVWFTFSGLPCLLQVLLTSHLRFLCVSSTHLDKNTNPNFPERRTNRKRNGIIIPWERSI